MPHTKAALANKFDEWESYLGALKLPAWDELPTLELYMDQVVIVLNDYLGMYAAGEDKTVTQAMINNYVKQKLIPPPVKKKYSRVHLALLMIICTLKQTLNISVVKEMLPDWDGDAVRRFYDRFITVQKGFGIFRESGASGGGAYIRGRGRSGRGSDGFYNKRGGGVLLRKAAYRKNDNI